MKSPSLPWALDNLSKIRKSIGERTPAFFLDFDGTLARLVPHPDMTALPAKTREVLSSLARDHVVCVVSGRDLTDLRQRVGLAEVHYAADHGHRIMGRAGSGIELEVGPEDRLELERASYELERRLRTIKGVLIETKGASLSVHYRLVAASERPLVHQIVSEVADAAPSLSLTAGKLVHDLRPQVAWGKGRAMLWLLGQLRLQRNEVCAICVGDDLTDEDMFASARGWGVSVVVGDPGRATRAEYMIADSDQVATFLEAFVTHPDNARSPLV